MVMNSLESVVNDVVNKIVSVGKYRTAYSAVTSREKVTLTGRMPVVPSALFDLVKNKKSPTGWAPPSSPFSDRIHKAQYKYICRDMYLWMFEPDSPEAGVLKRLGHGPLNKTRFQKFNKKIKHNAARQTLSAFYNRKSITPWWTTFASLTQHLMDQGDELKYALRLSHLLWGAIHPEGMPTLPMEFRTSTVIQLLKGIRKDEAFDRMPILADALQDAGFDQDRLLARLRDHQSIFSLGDWLFKTTGVLEMYNDSGSAERSAEAPPGGD
jgi:hypothetical protein